MLQWWLPPTQFLPKSSQQKSYRYSPQNCIHTIPCSWTCRHLVSCPLWFQEYKDLNHVRLYTVITNAIVRFTHAHADFRSVFVLYDKFRFVSCFRFIVSFPFRLRFVSVSALFSFGSTETKFKLFLAPTVYSFSVHLSKLEAVSSLWLVSVFTTSSCERHEPFTVRDGANSSFSNVTLVHPYLTSIKTQYRGGNRLFSMCYFHMQTTHKKIHKLLHYYDRNLILHVTLSLMSMVQILCTCFNVGTPTPHKNTQ